MERYRKVWKGTTPPPVLAVMGQMKRKIKRINESYTRRGLRHRRELQWLVGRLDDERGIIQRKMFPQLVTQQTMKLRSGICPHCWREPRNKRLLKVSIIVSPLNHFTFVLFVRHQFTRYPFHHVSMCVYSVHNFTILVSLYLCTNPFSHLTISPCEHGCVFYAPFIHIFFTIALYQYISPSRHFTFSPLLNFSQQRDVKKAASEQRAIELFGSYGLYEGFSD